MSENDPKLYTVYKVLLLSGKPLSGFAFIRKTVYRVSWRPLSGFSFIMYPIISCMHPNLSWVYHILSFVYHILSFGYHIISFIMLKIGQTPKSRSQGENLWYQRTSLVKWNTHVKYQSSCTNCSKIISNVKVSERMTKWQTDKKDKNNMPRSSISVS